MLQAAERILGYCAGVTEQRFRTDRQLLDAVVWNLTVLGEAAKNIPTSVELRFPELPWAECAAFETELCTVTTRSTSRSSGTSS